MKKLVVGTVLAITIAGYSYFTKAKTTSVSGLDTNRINSPITPSIPSPTNQETTTSSSILTALPTKVASKYKDGTYTGDVTDAFYGNVQVQATVTNGKIADIQLLQYPNDREESIQISNESIPQLKQEAIQAQNSGVDIVTGATQTSQAFIQSLQSALVKARNS